MYAYRLALLVAASIVGMAIGGCHNTRPNPEHCFHALGDQTCAELDPSRPYCAGYGCGDLDYGCVAERPADECYSPCGHDTLIDQDQSCIEVSGESETDTGSTETSSSGTTTDETDTGDMDCTDHADCPPEAAYCLAGSCTPCNGTPDPAAACFTLTERQSIICLDGACVECTQDDTESCEDASLVCDVQTHSCVPCTGHDQCAGGAGCDLEMGTCLPANAVWHVDGDGGQDFHTIGAALAALNNGSGTIVIHPIGAGGFQSVGYHEGIEFAGDRTLAVIGAAGELPVLSYMTPVSLQVEDGARVYVQNLIMRGEDAALVDSAHVEFDNVALLPSKRHALRMEDSEVRLQNSMLRAFQNPDIYPALEIVGTGYIDIRYSTFVAIGDGAAIFCPGAALAPGSRIRNSILINTGESPAVQCSSPSYETNGLEDATGFVNNTSIGETNILWFVNALYGDLHLTTSAPISISNAAIWAEGDPIVDCDGDLRPAVTGTSDFVGADIPDK